MRIALYLRVEIIFAILLLYLFEILCANVKIANALNAFSIITTRAYIALVVHLFLLLEFAPVGRETSDSMW